MRDEQFVWDEQSLLDCTLDIDDESMAAIYASWAAEGVDIEAGRESQAAADATVAHRVTPELVEKFVELDPEDVQPFLDEVKAIVEDYDDTDVRPHRERFRAANQRLLREHPQSAVETPDGRCDTPTPRRRIAPRMIADLRSFFGRPTVVELFVAFAVALASVSFVAAVATGLVYTPITETVPGTQPGTRSFEFLIGNRVFDTAGILTNGIVLAFVILGAAFLVKRNQDVLWQDDGEFVDCPHCLSAIPATASVCSACTRDVRSQPPSL